MYVKAPNVVNIHNKSMEGVDRTVFIIIALTLLSMTAINIRVNDQRWQCQHFSECPHHLVLGDEDTGDDQQPSGSTDSQAAEYAPDGCRQNCFRHFQKHVAVKPKRCRYTKCSRKSKYWCTKCRVYLCTDSKGILSYLF